MNRRIKIYLLITLSLLSIVFLISIAFWMGRRTAFPPSPIQAKVEPLTEKIISILPKQKPIKTVSEIVKEQGTTTVFIATYSKIGLELGLGSGFIISEDGKIVTSFHVLDNAYSASVKLTSGDVYDDVSVIDYDERRDIAVIKIKEFNLPVVNIGDSDEVKIGEKIVALGNPAGLENSVSDGIISATRDTEGYKLLQITCPISSGSSGGPVYNMKGEVVGVATSTITGAQNLNFAVPINYVRPLLVKEESISLSEFQDNFQKKKWIGGKFDIAKRQPIPQREEENRGYLGIFFDLTQPLDVLKIWSFRKYSPARESGLKAGDEIIQIDDFIIKGTSLDERKKHARLKKEGDISIFKILRDNEEKEIKVKYGKHLKPTDIYNVIADDLFLDRKVKLAIMVDEVNFIGPEVSNTQLKEWKKAQRRDLINRVQQETMRFLGFDDNFFLVDIGKIDVIINDLENQYGALPPQIRNNVLQSLGVTHLLEMSFVRYSTQKFFYGLWGTGEWKQNFRDLETRKLINLIYEEVLCIDTCETYEDYNGKVKEPVFDTEDEELWDYLKEMGELAKKKDLKL